MKKNLPFDFVDNAEWEDLVINFFERWKKKAKTFWVDGNTAKSGSCSTGYGVGGGGGGSWPARRAVKITERHRLGACDSHMFVCWWKKIPLVNAVLLPDNYQKKYEFLMLPHRAGMPQAAAASRPPDTQELANFAFLNWKGNQHQSWYTVAKKTGCSSCNETRRRTQEEDSANHEDFISLTKNAASPRPRREAYT